MNKRGQRLRHAGRGKAPADGVEVVFVPEQIELVLVGVVGPGEAGFVAPDDIGGGTEDWCSQLFEEIENALDGGGPASGCTVH